MPNLIVSIIADYGDLHDLAFAEVTQRLFFELQSKNVTIKPYAVPAFDTTSTGFALAQTAINSKLGSDHKFFVNTAPRKDNLGPRDKNAGEGLAYVKLYNGIEIVAVNSGYSLSFVKDAAIEIRQINCAIEGSQFRSRDVFPVSFGKIALGNYEELGDDIHKNIPDYPKNVVCYIDGYGNIKTSVDPQDIENIQGEDITLEINGQQQLVRASAEIFGVADGQYSFAKGSSGWNLPDGQRLNFSEIVKRGGNAAATFGSPQGGEKISWRTPSQ